MKPSRAHSTAVRIRKAKLADLPAVLALYSQPEIDNGRVLTLAQAKRIFAKFKKYPNYHLYVAIRDGRVVGAFTLLIMDNLAHLGAQSGVVEDVVVAVEAQRQGVGKRMMEFALERCRAAGCYKMALSSNLKRRGAHQFYESLGFTKHGYSYAIPLAAT